MFGRLSLTRSAATGSRSNRGTAKHIVVAIGSLGAASLIGCEGDAAKLVAPTVAVAQSSPSRDALANPRGEADGALAVVAAFDAAWNAGSADGIAAPFADNAEFVNGRGQVAVGTQAIRAQHAALFAGPFAGSHLTSTVRRVTFLTGTSAVVDVDTELTGFTSLPPGTNPTEPGKQRGRHKRVLVKRGGEWQVVLMQITSVTPAP